MPHDINSNNSFSQEGLNITPISSVDSFHINNDYSANFSSRSSFNSATTETEENAEGQFFNNGGYNFTSGYGLIDAAAAVSQVVGRSTFADVPDLGGNNWGVDLVKAPEVWANGYTGQGVVVAVLDTGVDYNHEDLKANIWTNSLEIAGNGKDDDGNGYIDDVSGWNFIDNNNEILDKNGHGTHVSGTIAGQNNDFGITGIAYDAQIMPVKVLDDTGSGSYSSISEGIYYAVNNGARVINLSLSSRYPNETLQTAIEYASSKGAVVVMAAGNNGGFQPDYPARYADEMGIAVGAVDKNKNMADFSNRAGLSPLTYVTAPGVNVYSTLPGNTYAPYNGTSMATPHVAGVVALMLSANNNLTDAQVRQIVAQTAVDSTQIPSSNSKDLTQQSNVTTSNFNLTQYQNGSFGFSQETQGVGKVSTSQNHDFKYVKFSSLMTNPTVEYNHTLVDSGLGSQFLSYQTTLDNNVNYSVSYNRVVALENMPNQPQEMLEEYREWLVNYNLG
jgi:subtilisin